MCVKHGAQCKSAPFNLKLEAHDAILVTRLYVQVLKTLFLSERHNNCVCSPPLPLPPDMCGVCVCVCVWRDDAATCFSSHESGGWKQLQVPQHPPRILSANHVP